MSDNIIERMNKAKAFAKDNLAEGAAELIEWDQTALLKQGGIVTQLAEILTPLDPDQNHKMARSLLEQAALAKCAAVPAASHANEAPVNGAVAHASQLTLAELNTLINKAIASAGTAHEIAPMAGTRRIKKAELFNSVDDMPTLAITTNGPCLHLLRQIIEQHTDYLVLTNCLGQKFDIHFKPLVARLTLTEVEARADSLPVDIITDERWCQAVKTLLTEKGPGFAIEDPEVGCLMFMSPGHEPAVLCSILRTDLVRGDYSSLIEVEAHNMDTPDADLSNPGSAFRQVISNPTYVELDANHIEGLTKACTGG